MNLTKWFAAILLIELFFACELASCAPLSEMVMATDLLLSYSGWKDILVKVKTKTAKGEFGDNDVAKVADRNEDIHRVDIINLIKHIFLMLNCRYASRLLFLRTIIKDLAAECGYFAYSYPMPRFPTTPLDFCEEVLYLAFQLTSMDLTYAYGALKYFQTLISRNIYSKGLRHIDRSLLWDCEQLIDIYKREMTTDNIRTQLQTTVSSLETFNMKLNEYFNKNCHEETGYPDLLTSYRVELVRVQEQSSLRELFLYLQKKIIEVSDDITEYNFKDCGFLYNSETNTCTIRQPETSTSESH